MIRDISIGLAVFLISKEWFPSNGTNPDTIPSGDLVDLVYGKLLFSLLSIFCQDFLFWDTFLIQ